MILIPVPRRPVARVPLLLVAAAVIVIAGAALAVNLVFPPARLTPLVRDGLARQLDAPVALRRASIGVFPVLAVQLDGLVVGDPRGYVRPAAWPRGGLVAARRAEASLALWPLLARRIEIDRVRLEDVTLTAVRNERGIGNWEGLGGRPAAAPTAPSPAFDLELRRLELARGRVRYYDARDGMYLAVRQLDATLAVSTGRGGRDQRFRLDAQAVGPGGRAPWPLGERPIRLVADVAGTDAGARWTVHRVALSRGRFLLSGHGTVDGPEQVLAFRLDQGTLPLADVLELLPADQVKSLGRLEGAGTIRLAAEAKGPLSRGRVPAVRARAEMADGRLAFRDRGAALEGLAFALTATERGADLARLAGRVGRSTFDVAGEARDWADPRLRGRVRAALDLADVSRFLPLADSTRLSGRVRVAVDGAGRAAVPAGFGWSGRVDLAEVAASGVGLGRPIDDVTGAIGLSPGRAWATGLSARIGASDLTIDGTVDRPFEWFAAAAGGAKPAPADAVARIAVRSKQLDLDALLPPARPDAKMPPVRAEGTFELGRVHVQKLDATRARGRFTYASGVTAVDEFALDAYGGRTRGRAWFDLRDAARPRYQVNATAESLDANQFVGAWTAAKDVAFGTLQMSIDLDGAGLTPADVARSLTVKGLAQVLGGRLAGSEVFSRLAAFTGVDRFRILSFRDLSAPFRVVGGRVVFDPIALSGGGTDWLARGSVGLDGTLDLAVAGLVPAGEVARLPTSLRAAAGAFVEKDGRLTLDLRVGGSATKPTLAWDRERTTSRLLARSPEAIAALAGKVGVDLGDSLSLSRDAVEARADAIVAAQKEKLAQEAEKRTEELKTKAIDELAGLFQRKSAPPPPADTSAAGNAPVAPAPAAPPDSAAADSARRP